MTTSGGPERLSDRRVLLVAAVHRILDTGRHLQPEEREAATVLLADLYAAGMRPRITPEDWSWVASLGQDCIDAIKQRALQQRQAQGKSLPPRRSRGLYMKAGRDGDLPGRDLW
jgi:hypothetical protein